MGDVLRIKQEPLIRSLSPAHPEERSVLRQQTLQLASQAAVDEPNTALSGDAVRRTFPTLVLHSRHGFGNHSTEAGKCVCVARQPLLVHSCLRLRLSTVYRHAQAALQRF